ncbi:MAG: diguanylate cyclase, partial [Pseudoalteromonas sp.]|nr:diguanylate cyclase [Pseudoalteromonas sp.]
LTVSVGACMSDSNSTFTELFKHADNAVYQAKANGKNTTYMHS